MPGPEPHSRPSQPAGGGDDSAEKRPATRPRVARRPPNTGPVLPTVTEDERDVGWGDTPEPDDEHLLREVPPHHGN